MCMKNADTQYFDLVRKILKDGKLKKDRTGTGTISIFDHTMRMNMDDGFPLLTSKKMFIKGIIYELIWFLNGGTNIKYLVDNDVHIWDGDAYKKFINSSNESLTKEEFLDKIKKDDSFAKKWGELGPVYGKQWRNWGSSQLNNDIHPLSDSNRISTESEWENAQRGILGLDLKTNKPIDQIFNLINDLKNNPDSRRLMVSAWNPSELEEMTLPPCHYCFQCYTEEMDLNERISRWCKSINRHISYGEDFTHQMLDEISFPKRKLSLKVTIRSNDIFLGCPFNIATYSLLLHLLSIEVNMIPFEMIMSIGDAHLYINHIDQAKLQLSQKTFKLPTIRINKKSIFDISFEDIKIIDYKSSPTIKADLSN